MGTKLKMFFHILYCYDEIFGHASIYIKNINYFSERFEARVNNSRNMKLIFNNFFSFYILNDIIQFILQLEV